MAANTGERTLIPAIIPPGAAHVDGVFSAAAPTSSSDIVAVVAAAAASLLLDFVTRVVPKGDIRAPQFERLPFVDRPDLRKRVILRSLRLNALSSAYSRLWAEAWDDDFRQDIWTGGLEHRGRRSLAEVDARWTPSSPLTVAADRRQAQLELDVLTAIGLGISADELCTIYRTQFPVLYGYDRDRDVFDANGHLIPTSVVAVWRRKGDSLTVEERTAVHPGSGVEYTYQLPFTRLDRERDFRAAFGAFSC